MEENQQNPISTGQSVRIVSPEAPAKKGKKKIVWVLFGIVFIAIAVLVGFYIMGNGNEEPTPTPTPYVSGFEDETSATPTPAPEVDKSEVSIEILNGTGIPGEAGFLQTKLKALGYTKIETGNADKQDNEITQVTFSTSLSKTVVDEIMTELESIYEDVNDRTSSTLSVDVQIVTGLRKGATPKASATPKVSATATPSPTATPTPTPTATPQ
jgi:hypothetical protein